MSFDFGLKDKLMEIRDEYFNTSNKKKKVKLQISYQELTHQEDVFDSTKMRQLKSYKPFDVGASSEFYDPELHHGIQLFDIVIGNPPYVRQEDIKSLKPYLKDKFIVFHSKADLLTYFIEQGFIFLKPHGCLNFIISNKFTRTDYGQVLRKFLIDKTKLLSFIDFEGVSVFESATVDAAILGLKKDLPTPLDFMKYFNVNLLGNKKDSIDTLLKNDLQNYPVSSLSKEAWSFQDLEKLGIKNSVSSQGIPLSKWDIRINYGVKTGLNKAFFLNEDTKNDLVKKDPNSINLLRPLIRGRDIGRYKVNYENLWLIGTFPSLSINIDEYPAIKEHLNLFHDELQQTGEKGSRKKTPGKWYEIQDNVAYWADFESPKILYPNMTKYMPFFYDINGYFSNDKSFIIVGSYLAYLTCFFNSKLFDYCFRENFPLLLGGTRELRKVFFDKIPVKHVSSSQDDYLRTLLNQIQTIAISGGNYSSLNREIDIFMYKHYGLSYDEILVVDSTFDLDEPSYEKIQQPK